MSRGLDERDSDDVSPLAATACQVRRHAQRVQQFPSCCVAAFLWRQVAMVDLSAKGDAIADSLVREYPGAAVRYFKCDVSDEAQLKGNSTTYEQSTVNRIVRVVAVCPSVVLWRNGRLSIRVSTLSAA